MFFTHEDYRKIEKWLLANSRKDTDFVGAATPLKGNETVVLVQDGKNVKTSVKDIVDQFFLLGVSDFLNITDKYDESYISLTQAIQLIPFRSRKIGQVITFIDESGNWAIYQFQGKALNQWNNTTLWIDLLAKISGTPIIDSEDITTKVDDAKQVSLYLADKQYNEADYSGLGKIYLRKNIQTIIDPSTGAVINVNLLTQSMLAKENTIYILQYDYNLNNQTITIPEGCILDMRGGSVTNGTINCVDTIIISTDASKLDVTLTGTYRFDSEKLVTSNTEDINISQSVDRKNLTISAMLADRDTTNGMGYVILRKDKSFKEQVTQENTIYEIRYDFDLNGQEVTIPEGCTLDFQGGSFSNGDIVGNSTTVNTNDIKKLFIEISFLGTWDFKIITEKYFSYTKDIDLLKNISILCSSNSYSKIILNSDYLIDKVPKDSYSILTLGSNTDLLLNGSISVSNLPYPRYNIIHAINSSNINIKSGHIIGDIDSHTGVDGEMGYGISLLSCTNVNISNITISKCWGDGIFIARDKWDSPTDVRPCKNILIESVVCDSNRRQGLSVIAVDGLSILNSQFNNTGTIKYNAPGYGIDIEPNNQWESANNINIIACQFINNKDITTNSDKSIVLYSPIYKNINNVNIKNCQCSGTISLRGSKNIFVNASDVNQFYFTDTVKDDNIKIENCVINQKEDYTYRDIVTLLNNAWRTYSYIRKELNLVGGDMKLVFPKFRGTLKVTIISNYTTVNYAYDKEILYKIDSSNGTYNKGATHYLFTGGLSSNINISAKTNSVRASYPVIDKSNMINIILSPSLNTIQSTIFIEAYTLYTESAIKLNADSFIYKIATPQEVSSSNFSELTSNICNLSTNDRLTNAGEGTVMYDTTLKKMILYNGTAWVNMDGTALT